MAALLDVDALASRLRSRSIRTESRELLFSVIAGSGQEVDLTSPPNCGGLGRVRHFRRFGSPEWFPNPLPIDPARKALSLPPTDLVRAQAFQNAACNWRCWYCYVPFNLLAADEGRGAWCTADELIARYAALPDRSHIIDLTGGQPDLVPEWLPWTMDALRNRGLEQSVYLWSDDNLSNDYFWKYLSDRQIAQVASWTRYGRVGCFKGFDPSSFAFNTAAPADHFERQFELMARFVDLGVDQYAYVTLTTPKCEGIEKGMGRFFDRMQRVHENLPLRTIPLEVRVFSPVGPRIHSAHQNALANQRTALDAYRNQLERRFSATVRELPICEVPLS